MTPVFFSVIRQPIPIQDGQLLGFIFVSTSFGFGCPFFGTGTEASAYLEPFGRCHACGGFEHVRHCDAAKFLVSLEPTRHFAQFFGNNAVFP